MRINAPLRSESEAAPLSAAGADGFYCGVRFPGMPDINNRPNDARFNLPDVGALARTIGAAHRLGRKVAVAVNKPSLDLKRALAFMREAESLGADELIVSSLALLHAARGRRRGRPGCRLSLSVTNPVFNAEALEFFRGYGVSKVCLPRHLGLDEIEALCRAKGDLEVEVFAMSGLCMNVEAYCGLPLCVPRAGVRRSPGSEPCHYRWRASPASPALEAQLRSREWDCGLCALWRFREMGVDSLKIEGRGDPLSEKAAYTSAVRAMLDVLEGPRVGRAAYVRRARRYFSGHAGPCRPEYCYY